MDLAEILLTTQDTLVTSHTCTILVVRLVSADSVLNQFAKRRLPFLESLMGILTNEGHTKVLYEQVRYPCALQMGLGALRSLSTTPPAQT